MEDRLKEIKWLVAENKLKRALKDTLNDTGFPNVLFLMLREYHEIEDSKMRSIITHEQRTAQLNDLTVNFLLFLDNSYLDIVSTK